VAKQTQTTYTFQVTFVAPKGLSIPAARELIRDALTGSPTLGLVTSAGSSLKVSLTNKEVKYG